MRARGPRLHERARRGEKQIRKADARCQKQKDAPDGLARIARLPTRAGQDRRSPRDRECQERSERENEESAVEGAGGARVRAAREAVRVEVSRQQHDLEEDEASGPHRGRSAEPGQDGLPHQRLDLKEKKRSEKDRQSVGEHE
jgi:hypothetical protein